MILNVKQDRGMVFLIILVLTIILLNGCSRQERSSKSTLELRALSGDIRSIKETTYGEYIRDGIFHIDSDIDMFLQRHEFFNRQGMLKKTAIYNENNELQFEYVKHYNDGKLKNETSNTPNHFGNVQTKVEYSDDFLIEIRTEVNDKGQETFKAVIKYTVGGLVKSRMYYINKEHSRSYKFTYDDSQNILSELAYGSSGELEYTDYYEYDELGNQIVERRENANEFMNYRIEKSYDEHGNVIEEIKSIGEYIESETIYEYNYDDNGNWILKITSDDEVKKKVIREIKYY